MKKTALWKQLALSAVLVAVAGAGWHFRSDVAGIWTSSTVGPSNSPAKASERRGTPVIVAEVKNVRDDLTFSAIGTGLALRSVTLRAPSGGEITALEIASGRRFSTGDTLMKLEDTDERLAVALAEARLERATSERNRYRALQDTGAAAAARIEQAQTDFEVARIELEKARADLEDRVLRAPFDGVTGLAAVEAGDRISPDDPISGFDDRSLILVEFDVPEALLGRIAPGQKVSAQTPAAEGLVFDGEVTAIDSRVDAGTRTARVRAAIDNRSDRLRPGASFALRIELPGQTYPAVPELALQFSRGALHVWRVAAGKTEQVPVRLVRRRAGLVFVDGPLADGDSVVVEGTQRLRPGVSVDVLNMPIRGGS